MKIPKEPRIDYKTLYINENKENQNLRKKLILANEKIIKLNNKLMDYRKNGDKGSLAPVNGILYEKMIFNIVKYCYIDGNAFNTQHELDLGGSTSNNDIVCNYNSNQFGIEIKKYNSPDWMQCSIKYDSKNRKWIASNGKIPSACRKIFNELINNINLYNGDIPPFMERRITYNEWIEIKSKTDKWNDHYISIPNDTIKKLYKEKGCEYIQLSNGYGLYCLGSDICNFKVPNFIIDQQLRIRTKIHTKKTKTGYCSLSVTVSCKPINIKSLNTSPYSLDNINKLPSNFNYIYSQ